MAITSYMTYDEVRTTCGLSSDELSDSVLALPIYETSMKLRASDVAVPSSIDSSSDLITAYTTVSEAASPTAMQTKFLYMARLFLIYAVAAEVIVSLSMRAPKTMSDGKAVKTRFSPEMTFQDVASNIFSRLGRLRLSIENIDSTAETAILFGVAEPETDAVTDE